MSTDELEAHRRHIAELQRELQRVRALMPKGDGVTIEVNVNSMSDAVIAVAHERLRQEAVEGWTPEHDNSHSDGQMVQAALCYAINALTWAQLRKEGWTPEHFASVSGNARVPKSWPWHARWWKPKGQRRNLVIAAALLVAEIERIDRAEKAAT